MHRIGTMGMLLTGTALAGGTQAPVGAPARLVSATTTAFQPCAGYETGGLPTEVGVLRIRLERKIVIGGNRAEGDPIVRSVFYQPGRYDPAVGDPKRPRPGVEAENKPNPNKPEDPALPTAAQPFHIYTGGGAFPASGFVRVRILIPDNAKYSFHVATDQFGQPINGVGVADLAKGSEVCGRVAIDQSSANFKQAASFFIDAARIRGVPERLFNIAVASDEAKATPIFIDPKVRNDG